MFGEEIRVYLLYHRSTIATVEKKQVYYHCLRLVQKKLADIELAIREAQLTANEETKSSAGDKYETGRAMMHLEQEKLASQRVATQQLKKVLDQIDPTRSAAKVGLGSLVQTNRGWFLVAVGIGQVEVEGESCFVISPAAPLGKALWGRQPGEIVLVNAQATEIMAVQ